MNKKVLLINIPTTRGNRDLGAAIASMPPLGQLYIATYLQQNGYEVQIWDLAVERMHKKEFIEKISSLSPLIIGISSFYESWSNMINLCEVVKTIFPDTYVAIGGNGATFSYQEILMETLADFVLLGEGEYSFFELCEYLNGNINDINSISGVARMENGKIKISDPKRISVLDNLPFPNRKLIDPNKYTYPYTICTTRGCIGKCKFCSSGAFYGNHIAFRTIDNIIEEICYMSREFFMTEFFVIDDTFTINKKRALSFCEKLSGLKKSFRWFCEARADSVDEELLSAMRKVGCFKIQFGMESGNNEILKKIGKNITIQQIEKVVAIAYSLGMQINLSFIIGHPDDTIQTIKESFKFAEKMKTKYKANVLCSINTPYPGTYNYIHSEQLGIEILTDKKDFYTMNNCIINTKNLDRLTINKLFHDFHMGTYNEIS